MVNKRISAETTKSGFSSPTFKSFTLNKIQIIGLFQNPGFKASYKTLQISMIDIERKLWKHFCTFPLSLAADIIIATSSFSITWHATAPLRLDTIDNSKHICSRRALLSWKEIITDTHVRLTEVRMSDERTKRQDTRIIFNLKNRRMYYFKA